MRPCGREGVAEGLSAARDSPFTYSRQSFGAACLAWSFGLRFLLSIPGRAVKSRRMAVPPAGLSVPGKSARSRKRIKEALSLSLSFFSFPSLPPSLPLASSQSVFHSNTPHVFRCPSGQKAGMVFRPLSAAGFFFFFFFFFFFPSVFCPQVRPQTCRGRAVTCETIRLPGTCLRQYRHHAGPGRRHPLRRAFPQGGCGPLSFQAAGQTTFFLLWRGLRPGF